MALLYARRRTVSARATSDAVVWALHRTTYLDLMVNAPCAGGEGGLGIIAFLRRLPLFGGTAGSPESFGGRPASPIKAGAPGGSPGGPQASSKLYRIGCALQSSHFADGHTVRLRMGVGVGSP